MPHVSIIGGGNMGRTIATIVAKGGNTVEVFNTDDADKPVTGDVVFLAVPYPAVADVLVQRGDQLAGKVVVGITRNPHNFETFDSPVVPADASVAAEITTSLPQPRALDDVTPNSTASLASGAMSELPTTVLIGGNDADSADGLSGWHSAPDEGSSRWWYLGMFVLVLTLLALLTLLRPLVR